MSRTAHLYLKLDDDTVGPFSTEDLHAMVQEGTINKDTRVSPDGMRWLAAEKIKGLLNFRGNASSARKAVSSTSTRPELRDIFSSVHKSIPKLSYIFHGSVAAGTIFTMCAVFTFLLRFAESSMEYPNIFVIAAIAYIPSLMVGAAAGHLAGNLSLRLATGISDIERRCLALHLPWQKAPAKWDKQLKNWVYGGDWLIDKEPDEMLPYIRVFMTGNAPETINEELHVWEQLMKQTSCGANESLEVGHSARELAILDKLPEWTKDIEPGTSLNRLLSKLGQPAHDWAVSLLKRASIRIPDLGDGAAESNLDNAFFEFNFCRIEGGREALVVIIRPRTEHNSSQALMDISEAA